MVGAALLFGSTFAVVKNALDVMSPASFVGWRFLLGGALLFVLRPPRDPATWRDGALAGAVLWAGFQLQTEGLVTTAATASGLITGLTVVLTPLLAATVVRRRPSGRVATAAVVAFGGIAVLTLRGFPGLPESLVPGRGDMLTVACAVAFSAHVLVIDRVAARHAVVGLATVQLLVVSGLSLGFAGLTGQLAAPPRAAWGELLATGIGVSAGAYLLQIWAQRHLGPSRTAILLALEPVFAAIFGWFLLGERFTAAGWLGAGLVLGAIALAVAEPGPSLPERESAEDRLDDAPSASLPSAPFERRESCDTVASASRPGERR